MIEYVAKELQSKDTSQVNVKIAAPLSYAIELLNVMAVATRGKNAITEVMCQSLLPAPDFIKCYKEAKFVYTYKTALVEYFVDAYLDIEKDVPPNLQDDIWEFTSLLEQEFEIFMTKNSDAQIFYHYKNNGGQTGSGPKIWFDCLFGKSNLRKQFEYFVCETLLNCIEHIFQLRLVIKNSQGKFLYL